MLELKGVPVVKANAEKIAPMNARDYVAVLVKEDAKAGVLAVAISVLQDVLNHALLAVMENVKTIVVGTARIIVAAVVEIVVVVVAVTIVIVQLTTMIKKISPDS